MTRPEHPGTSPPRDDTLTDPGLVKDRYDHFLAYRLVTRWCTKDETVCNPPSCSHCKSSRRDMQKAICPYYCLPESCRAVEKITVTAVHHIVRY